MLDLLDAFDAGQECVAAASGERNGLPHELSLAWFALNLYVIT